MAEDEGKRHFGLLTPSGIDPVRAKRPELFLKMYWENVDEHTAKPPVRIEHMAETEPTFLAAWWGVDDAKYALRISSGMLRFLSEVAKSYELARISQDPDQRPAEAAFFEYYEYLSYVGGGHYVWHPIPAFEQLVHIDLPPVKVNARPDAPRDVPQELTTDFLEFLGSALRTPEISELVSRAIREKGFVDSAEFKEKVSRAGLAPGTVERLRLLAIYEGLPRSLADEKQRLEFNEMMRYVLHTPDMADLIAAGLTNREYARSAKFQERVLALPEPRDVRERFEQMVAAEDFPVLFGAWISELEKAIRTTNRRLVSALVAHEIGHLALGYPERLLAQRGLLLGGQDDAQIASALRLITYDDADEARVDDWYVEAVGTDDPPGYGLFLLLDAFKGVRHRMLGDSFRYVFLHPVASDRIPDLVNAYLKKGQDLAKTKPLAERVIAGYVTRASDLRKMAKGWRK